LQNKLLAIRHKHFSARNAKEKTDLRKEYAKLSKELSDLLKKDGFYNSSDAAQMAAWNPYDQTASSPFFDSYWMFGVEKGFDMVIGNPPYVRADSLAIAGKREIILQSGQYETLWDDDSGIICNHSIIVFKRFCDLKDIEERSISVSISKNNFEEHGGKTTAKVKKRRVELEKLSEAYSLKYILTITAATVLKIISIPMTSANFL
jgi:hypothetical protein